MMSTPAILLLLTFSWAVRDAQGHGRMIDPPARGSLWRFGFRAAENYNDNADRCGGQPNPADIEGVKCGVCGNGVNEEKKNEHGGKYGQGIIAKTYTQGELIEITIQITAAHKGWFEFRLCKTDSDNQPDSQECLNQNLLQMKGGGTRYQLRDSLAGDYTVPLYLPEGITCDRCVLQWRYHTGNSWGNDRYGRGIGFGDQEEFYGCADVRINPGGDNDDEDEDEDTQNDPNNSDDEEEEEETESEQDGEEEESDESEDTTENEDGQENENENEDGQDSGRQKICKSAGRWAGQANIDIWCQQNCLHKPPYCPISHCSCTDIGPAAREMDETEEDVEAKESSECELQWFVAEDAADGAMNLVCQQECTGEGGCPLGCRCYVGQWQSCEGTGALAGQSWAANYCRAMCVGGNCPTDCYCG